MNTDLEGKTNQTVFCSTLEIDHLGQMISLAKWSYSMVVLLLAKHLTTSYLYISSVKGNAVQKTIFFPLNGLSSKEHLQASISGAHLVSLCHCQNKKYGHVSAFIIKG